VLRGGGFARVISAVGRFLIGISNVAAQLKTKTLRVSSTVCEGKRLAFG